MTKTARDMSEMVEEFQLAFGVPDLKLQEKLVEEEYKELREALSNSLKETCDLLYVLYGFLLASSEHGVDPKKTMSLTKDVSELKRLFNELWGGDSVLIEAFTRVHQSNMSKLGEDGKPVRRADGKVVKGLNYKPPVLDDLIFI
jgi:predicted HAD superfamily Cof-like phosphohydrolase